MGRRRPSGSRPAAPAKRRSPPVAWALALTGRSNDALALFEVPARSMDETTAADAELLLGRVVAETFTGAVREARTAPPNR